MANQIEILIDELKETAKERAFKSFLNKEPVDPVDKNILWLLENDHSLESKIYRWFPLERLEQVFKDKQLALVRVSDWEDPFENFFLKSKIQESDGTSVSLNSIANSWYGQCWTICKESDALWRIYSEKPLKQGIRVSTTIRKLFDTLYDKQDQFACLNHYLTKVRYFDREVIESWLRESSFWYVAHGGQSVQFAALLSVKRLEFEHEHEVRLLKHLSEPGEKCQFIPLEPNSVFDTITFDPRNSAEEMRICEDRLSLAGCNVKIEESQLYKIDQFTISP